MTRPLTIRDAAALLGVPPRTIIELMNSKTGTPIPAFMVGNEWRFLEDEIEAWARRGGSVGPKLPKPEGHS